MSVVVKRSVEDKNIISFVVTTTGNDSSFFTIQEPVNQAIPVDFFSPQNWAPDAIRLFPATQIIDRPPVRFKDLKSRDCPYTPNKAWEAEWKKQE